MLATFGFVGGIASAIALHGPLGKALRHGLEGGPAGSDETAGALRLLARQPEPGRLAEEPER